MITSQCWPMTSTRSSTSLLRDMDNNESTPKLLSINAQPARRSESKEDPSESFPGAEVDSWIGLAWPGRDGGRSVEEGVAIGRCRIMVMAYIGLFRDGGNRWGALPPRLGKGKPLVVPTEFCGVGVRTLEVSCSSSGIVTENMRVMKMVRLLASFGPVLLLSLAGRSGGMLPGVKDLARLLRRRKPSELPREPVPSCIDGFVALGSVVLDSSGTMWILFEFPL